MNNFLLNQKKITQAILIKKNYGLAKPLFTLIAKKNNLSYNTINKKVVLTLNNYITKESNYFNRLLRLSRKKHIEEIKKQSSWRSLRFRQGLPVNGQRTHTNASVSKKTNVSMYLYNI